MSRLRMLMEQGDPGLFDIVRRLGGAAIRTFVPGGSTALALAGALRPTSGAAGLGLVPRAIGQGGLRAAGPGSREALLRQLQPRRIPGRILPAFPPIELRRATPAPAAAVAIGRRRRRMNPCNFRALQRGLRRLKSFSKLARTIIKTEVRFKAPRKRGGFRRKR